MDKLNKYHPHIPEEFMREWIALADLPTRPRMSDKYDKGIAEFRAEMASIVDDAGWKYAGYLMSELHRNWEHGMVEAVQLWQTSERTAAKKMKSYIYSNNI
jgi:hypothetical protein